jgi:membrane protease YdiL (CAAX protease family)
VKVRLGILAGMALVGLLIAVGTISTTGALAAALVVVVPGLAFGQLALLDRIRPARIELYRSSMLSIGLLGGVTFVDGFYNLGLAEMGLGTVRPVFHLLWGGLLGVVSVGVIWIFDALVGRLFDVQEPEFLRMLLPRTANEKRAFFLLSVFAGVGEEIAYRGFLLTAVALWSGSAVLALVVSSVAFALVHAYQATPGMLRTGVLGLLLGGSLLVTRSLIPAIVAHTLIDWVMGLWLGPRLLGRGIVRAPIDPGPEVV